MRPEKIAIPTADRGATWSETSAIDAIPADWRPHWDALAFDASECNVFAERWFVEAGIRHLPPGGETRMVAIWSGDPRQRSLVGLLPVRIERRYGRTPVRHVQNWVHHQSFLGTPLVSMGREDEFWTCVIETLDAADWAPGFFHIAGLVEDGPVHRALTTASARLGRPCATVHRCERALLIRGLSAQGYYEASVRKKKRKELGRLAARLAEIGQVRFETLTDAASARSWCEDFLALEAKGWKGRAGSALASRPETAAFFRDVFLGGVTARRLEAIRLTVGDRLVAMLVNFQAEEGGFSYKIAFDEAFARFSPGVLIEIENLRVLDRPGFAWMDSCAVENHPMIDSLWRERRSIVRVTVSLAGAWRTVTYNVCRLLEEGSALLRCLRSRRNG